MAVKEKELVIKAIGELGRRVTAADVATKTGLPVLVVQQEVNKVASETGGHLQVGTAGDIVYSFAPGFSSAYLAKGLAAVFQKVAEKVGQALMYLLRISFGIALILSLICVIILIIGVTLIMIKGLNNDRDGDRGDGGFDWFSGGNQHFSFWDWMVIRDLLWWNSYSSYSDPYYYDYSRPTIRPRSRSSFLLNCFSFLFGDGDPNEGLDEKRWQVIAQVIKRNKNVVTAEQLAPYLGPEKANEDSVLPVLVRFNGRPEVTDKGNIVYVFESLQSVAASQNAQPPAYLQEFPWKFSNVPSGEMLPVYIVAGLNVGGALWLFNTLHHYAVTKITDVMMQDPLFVRGWHNLNALVAVLLVYGTLFVGIPLVRVGVNALRNRGIEKRNNLRFRYSQIVAHPTPELAVKLKEAKEHQLSDRFIAKNDVAYTTEKGALDQDDDLSVKFKQIETEFDASP